MDPQRLTLVREIFADAIDSPSDQRADLLDVKCAQDGELRLAVESLLAAHDNAGDFLADPHIQPERFLPSDAPEIGTTIGPYTLIKPLGEGGYGYVYLASQETPIRRQVAIKIIKPGMDTRQVISRFEAERQALALMDHPLIAKVFDAGTTAAERPYFVMEYVAGEPITKYCQSRNLPLEDRLTLFSQVCAAVQHAHHKGVIHRDLKPANILVATVDGQPVPKIIDFGIAKALLGKLTDRTLLTTEFQILGTPQYMSPEQAGAAPDVDTRADIYSLGVVLYEMLAGVTPLDPAQLKAAAGEEMLRLVRESDPPLPSTRLLTLTTPARSASEGASWGIRETLSLARRASVRILRFEPDSNTSHSARRAAQSLRGELDWIVMRALEKNRERRYETADALAADVARYLADEPVAARPPSKIYRFAKFARRNRGLLAAAAMVLLALGVGLAVAAVGLVHASQERDNAVVAQAAETTARKHAETATAAAQASQAKAEGETKKLVAAQTFLFRLLSPTLGSEVADTAPQEMLDFAARKIDAERELLQDHPEIESLLHAALGNAYSTYGLTAKTQDQFRRSLESGRRAFPGDHSNTASTLNNLANSYLIEKKFDEAEPLLKESLGMYRRLNHKDNIVDAPVLTNLATVLFHKGEYAEAQSLLEIALVHFRAQFGPDSPKLAGVEKLLAEVIAAQKENAKQISVEP